MATIGALAAIVAYFLIDFKSTIDKTIQGFSEEMKTIQRELSKDLKSFGLRIDNHKDSLGRAGKAINGDMLEIRKSAMSLRESISEEISSMKSEVFKLESKASGLAGDIKISTKEFNDKFGQLIKMNEDVETTYGKVILLEKHFDKMGTKVRFNKEAHYKTKEILKRYREEINTINDRHKALFRKGGN